MSGGFDDAGSNSGGLDLAIERLVLDGIDLPADAVRNLRRPRRGRAAPDPRRRRRRLVVGASRAAADPPLRAARRPGAGP